MKNMTKLPGKNGKTTGPSPLLDRSTKQKGNKVTTKR